MQTRWKIALVVLAATFLAIQFLPVGEGKTNPPVTAEPEWDSPRTRELAVRACFDCHSNESEWLWYHRIAPVSWLVEHDVAEAREHLNFSEWDRPQRHADEAAEEVEEGEMPLWQYELVHPEARLDDDERAELIAGLVATLGEEPEDDEGGRGRGRGRGREGDGP